MTITTSTRLAATYFNTLSLPFRTANTANWLQFYVGPVPSDVDIENLTSSSDSILSAAKVGQINSNAGATWIFQSGANQPLYMNTLPTVKTFSALQTGTITHAVVTGDSTFLVVSVSALNGGGVIQVDNPVITSAGQIVTLQSIQFKVWR